MPSSEVAYLVEDSGDSLKSLVQRVEAAADEAETYRDESETNAALTSGVDYVEDSLGDISSPSDGETALILSSSTGKFYEYDGGTSSWNQVGPTLSEKIYQEVDDITELRNLEPAGNYVAFMRGYHGQSSKGGGYFWWDSGATNGGNYGNGGTLVESQVAGYTPGDANEGLWRRVYGGERINVRWWGAQADGSYDDTFAVQRAISWAERDGPTQGDNVPKSGDEVSTVYFPRGYYNLDPIVIDKSGIELVGDGQRETVFKCRDAHGSNNYLFTFDGGPDNTNRLLQVGVRNLSYVGHRADERDNVKGFLLKRCSNWYFQDVLVSKTDQALRTLQSYTGHLKNCNFIRNFEGVRLEQGTNDVSIIGCRFNQQELSQDPYAGLFIRQSAGIGIFGCNFEGSDIGLYLRARVRGVQISGNYFEAQNITDISLVTSGLDSTNDDYNDDLTPMGVSITGNQFNTGKSQAIKVKGYDADQDGSLSGQNQLGGVQISGNFCDKGHTQFVNFAGDLIQVDFSSITIGDDNYLDGSYPLTNQSDSREAEIRGTARDLGAYDPNVNNNLTTDRTYDPDNTTTAELADVVGTLISDLQAAGIIGE